MNPNLIPHITVAIRRHAHDLELIGEVELANDLYVWAKALTNEVQPEPSPKPHNPDGLTPEQVDVADGWRLLDEDEILPYPQRRLVDIQIWYLTWDTGPWQGSIKTQTYRTKLSREALAEARKGKV